MTIRKILVPFTGNYEAGDAENLDRAALRVGIGLGRKFEAHVEVFCEQAESGPKSERLPPWIPGAMVEELLSKIDKEDTARHDRALEEFKQTTSAMAATPVPTAEAGTGFSVSFEEEAGDLPRTLALRGRLADLIVVANNPADGGPSPSLLLEVAMRDTGRPVLVVSAETGDDFGRHIAVAWNGSKEASHAVALADDFLIKAEKVTIISARENGLANPGPKDLADLLALHGIAAEICTIESGLRTGGQAIIDQIAKVGADMLVMGAYSRSRVRQLVLGDVTRSVLANPVVPAFMVD